MIHDGYLVIPEEFSDSNLKFTYMKLDSEPVCLAKLSAKGYTVSKPFSDHCRYDLIIELDGNMERVQVKTGRLKDGRIKFKTESEYANTSQYVRTSYSKKDIDCFVVYCPDNEEIYKIDVENTPDTAMHLRVDKPKNGQEEGINWAENYKITG